MESSYVRVHPKWPPEGDRAEAAAEILGIYMVSEYDDWFRIGWEILGGASGELAYRAPDAGNGRMRSDEMLRDTLSRQQNDEDEMRAFFRAADKETCRAAMVFGRMLLHGVLSSHLVTLDGASGSVLLGDYRDRLRIQLDIYPRGAEFKSTDDPPSDSVVINAKHRIELRERWIPWLMRYSRSFTDVIGPIEPVGP